MAEQALDPRLAADTHLMGYFGDTQVLLLRNAHYPWLILVPATTEIEFHRLSASVQAEQMALASRLAEFIEGWCEVDKINIAAIGNVVSQMHLHVIGRRQSDPSWPGVVWGAEPFKAYEIDELKRLFHRMASALGDDYHPGVEPELD